VSEEPVDFYRYVRAAYNGEPAAISVLLDNFWALPEELQAFTLGVAAEALKPKPKGRPTSDSGRNLAINMYYKMRRAEGQSRETLLSEIAERECLSVDQVGRIVNSKT